MTRLKALFMCFSYVRHFALKASAPVEKFAVVWCLSQAIRSGFSIDIYNLFSILPKLRKYL